jgi:hypothetical protein
MKAFAIIAGLVVAGVALTAFGQQLPSVIASQPSGGIPWWITMPLALVIGGVVVFAFLKRKDPAKADALQAAATNELGKLIAAAKEDWTALRQHVADLSTDLQANTAATAANTVANGGAPAPAADAKAAPAAPATAGKNGVAGVMTLTVTGNPKADLDAFNAAYFG